MSLPILSLLPGTLLLGLLLVILHVCAKNQLMCASPRMLFHCLFKIYLFILRERVQTSVREGKGQRGKDRILSRHHSEHGSQGGTRSYDPEIMT